MPTSGSAWSLYVKKTVYLVILFYIQYLFNLRQVKKTENMYLLKNLSLIRKNIKEKFSSS